MNDDKKDKADIKIVTDKGIYAGLTYDPINGDYVDWKIAEERGLDQERVRGEVREEKNNERRNDPL